MNQRNNLFHQHSFPNEHSPINPFLKTTRQDRKRANYRQTSPVLRSRSPSPGNLYKSDDSYPFCSWGLFLPIILITSVLILFYFCAIYKNNDLIFCDNDKINDKCKKCPENGICTNGKLTCKRGFTQVFEYCVSNNDMETRKTIELYHRMCIFIASSIKTNCEADQISYDRLNQEFGRECNYQRALFYLENEGNESFYQISYLPPSDFQSRNPILDTKCKAQLFCDENASTLLLFGIIIALILILCILIAYNQRTNSKIKRCSREVIKNIKRTQRGEFNYASEFSLAESNPMSRFWDRISREVERDPGITVLNGSKGKLWGYV